MKSWLLSWFWSVVVALWYLGGGGGLVVLFANMENDGYSGIGWMCLMRLVFFIHTVGTLVLLYLGFNGWDYSAATIVIRGAGRKRPPAIPIPSDEQIALGANAYAYARFVRGKELHAMVRVVARGPCIAVKLNGASGIVWPLEAAEHIAAFREATQSCLRRGGPWVLWITPYYLQIALAMISKEEVAPMVAQIVRAWLLIELPVASSGYPIAYHSPVIEQEAWDAWRTLPDLARASSHG